MNDPYDNGTSKYATASDIYEAISDLVAAEEEIGILSEMFEDVSWDGQSYYYINEGVKLKERFDTLIEWGEKMWLLDLAAWQLAYDNRDYGFPATIHDFVYDCLCNDDLAKRLNFKALFVEHMCRGMKVDYKMISEAFCEELRELSRFDRLEMISAYTRAMNGLNMPVLVSPYDRFCDALCSRAEKLQLHKERALISECRALLISYDDFIFGLRVNQQLHTDLEKRFSSKVTALQEEFERRLMLIAEAAGVPSSELLALSAAD